MPPSGFSQPAINGLLVFVKETYASTLERYKSRNLSEEQVLKEIIEHLESQIEKSAKVLGETISQEGIKGLQEFVTTNFQDLIAEIHSGKKTEGRAMQTEIENIGAYLAQFKL